MLNVIIVVGRLTKDPIQRDAGEVRITNFSVAIDSLRRNEAGEKGTTFLDVVAFNAVGESCAKSLSKGSKVAVKGSIQQRSFTRKDGSKGVAYEIIADSVEFLDPKPQQADPEDGRLESAGSLDGEEYTDEAGIPNRLAAKPAYKFDPETGKPLTAPAKRK